MNRNNDQHSFENTWPLSSCIIFDWQDCRISKALLLGSLTVTYLQRRYHLPFQTHQFHQLCWSYCENTLQKKKTISENDIEPLIFIFSLWWQMCENNQTDQNWIISKRTVTILLSNLNSAQNNMTFILWGALGRHYSKMVLQTEVYRLL